MRPKDPVLLCTIHNGSGLRTGSFPISIRRRNHSTTASSPSSSSVSSAEMNHFATLASSWWDPLGPSRILHLMNPLRHEFIASCLSQSHTHRQQENQPGGSGGRSISGSTGLSYLDIGCGGGIFAESLARTIPLTPSGSSTNTNASSLLAIDPSPVMIEIALSHARKDPTLYTHIQTGKFQYKNTSLEDLIDSTSAPTADVNAAATNTPSFDMITLFEVLEHVDPLTSSPQAFLRNCLRLLKPGGWLVGSTIARTWPSYVINQVIAEAPWPIGVVPKGTHEWSKFVNPEELRRWAEIEGSPNIEWRCVGAMYAPGLGWKMVPGSEQWGNYFWGIRKL
ncbi:Hexaprenyldihydroxybenzoate methyltransferase, mitochondrial [Microsporum audouinii]